MVDIEKNEIGAAEIYKPKTQVASKTPTVNDDNALEQWSSRKLNSVYTQHK